MTFVPICGEALAETIAMRDGNAEVPIRGGALFESMNATAAILSAKAMTSSWPDGSLNR
jgi:hypothetical protein